MAAGHISVVFVALLPLERFSLSPESVPYASTGVC